MARTIAEDEQVILDEVEQLGRLTPEQEDILYNISLRQDELGRQPTNMLYDQFKANPVYKDLVDREYLAYEVYNHGAEGSHEVVSLQVTLKGTRYCILFADEIEPRRRFNSAGELREFAKPEIDRSHK